MTYDEFCILRCFYAECQPIDVGLERILEEWFKDRDEVPDRIFVPKELKWYYRVKEYFEIKIIYTDLVNDIMVAPEFKIEYQEWTPERPPVELARLNSVPVSFIGENLI